MKFQCNSSIYNTLINATVNDIPINDPNRLANYFLSCSISYFLSSYISQFPSCLSTYPFGYGIVRKSFNIRLISIQSPLTSDFVNLSHSERDLPKNNI